MELEHDLVHIGKDCISFSLIDFSSKSSPLTSLTVNLEHINGSLDISSKLSPHGVERHDLLVVILSSKAIQVEVCPLVSLKVFYSASLGVNGVVKGVDFTTMLVSHEQIKVGKSTNANGEDEALLLGDGDIKTN